MYSCKNELERRTLARRLERHLKPEFQGRYRQRYYRPPTLNAFRLVEGLRPGAVVGVETVAAILHLDEVDARDMTREELLSRMEEQRS